MEKLQPVANYCLNKILPHAITLGKWAATLAPNIAGAILIRRFAGPDKDIRELIHMLNVLAGIFVVAGLYSYFHGPGWKAFHPEKTLLSLYEKTKDYFQKSAYISLRSTYQKRAAEEPGFCDWLKSRHPKREAQQS